MNSVDNETCRQAILGELLPNVVRMPRQHGMRAVSDMRGERRSGAHRVLDLLTRRPGVADAGHHSFTRQLLDVMRSFGPFRRESHKAHMTARGVLPAQELFVIGRPYPTRRVRAARSILSRNVRALDV